MIGIVVWTQADRHRIGSSPEIADEPEVQSEAGPGHGKLDVKGVRPPK